jgi:hypothetical protein
MTRFEHLDRATESVEDMEGFHGKAPA